MKNKVKQPKMDYATKMTATVLEVMEISNKNEYNDLILEIRKLLSEAKSDKDEIDTGIKIMNLLVENMLFCSLACSIMGDTLKDLPQFKEIIS